MNLFLLKIDKFVNDDMKCFCVRDMRGKAAWLDGAKQAAFDRKFSGELLHTGSYGECVSYCVGFAKAVYHDWREITSVTKDAAALREELCL